MIAVVAYLHRRSGDPSRTGEESYWKKASLSRVADADSFVTAEDFAPKKKKKKQQNPVSLSLEIDQKSALQNMVKAGQQAGSNGMLLKYFREPSLMDKMDMYILIQRFGSMCQTTGNLPFFLSLHYGIEYIVRVDFMYIQAKNQKPKTSSISVAMKLKESIAERPKSLQCFSRAVLRGFLYASDA